MDQFDIREVTVEGMEPGGGSVLIRLESADGSILIRLPIEKAHRFAGVLEWCVTPKETIRASGELRELGRVETLTQATIGQALGGEGPGVFMSLEADSGTHRDFVLDLGIAESLATGLEMALTKSRIRH